ncbi:spore germination protein KC [Natronincola peptidivorans]|uniref:Spore germination protein KC n=1 Tax=Natronincola peptidivorans TaxID=426128 RepID=A0A1I0E8M6_9FIRM|nr:Ger(x)C family spore germination protein [Natronincola peptidivorans]SET40702.1 spore germination protein KC [Natronincola peptidivorans]
MIRNKKAKVITMVFVIIFLLTGCWDYVEIEDLIIVAGLAIDTGSGNNYLVTIETVDLEQSQGGDVQPDSRVVQVEGSTVFDAVRNAIKISTDRYYWSHADVLILSEEIARGGIVKVLEPIIRSQEPRLTMKVLVSKENKASDILPYDTPSNKILSFEIVEMLNAQQHLSKAPNYEVYEVIDKVMASGISTVIPTIGLSTIEGEKTPEVSGLAMFKKDSLVGFLDGEEAKTYLFITNEIKGGVLVESYPSEASASDISLSIKENKTKIQHRYENEKVVMEIKTNIKAVIHEWDISDSISEESINDVKKLFEASLRKDIEILIKKVQRDYQCDIFGFGQILKNQNPQLWRKLEENWENIFANLEIEVDTMVDIINTNLLSNTIKVGD